MQSAGCSVDFIHSFNSQNCYPAGYTRHTQPTIGPGRMKTVGFVLPRLWLGFVLPKRLITPVACSASSRQNEPAALPLLIQRKYSPLELSGSFGQKGLPTQGKNWVQFVLQKLLIVAMLGSFGQHETASRRGLVRFVLTEACRPCSVRRHGLSSPRFASRPATLELILSNDMPCSARSNPPG
jgi:hypothetical protein